MADGNHAYMKELYKLSRTIDRLTCGQARLDHSCEQERSFYLFITPDDGYYKGATCKFQVTVPETFPTHAPLVHCLNRIYHPNIDIDPCTSEVCVNLLDEDWQSGVGLDGCVMAVLYLFHHPNLEDALNQLFGGDTMNELDFMENVRVSLRGGEVDGFTFDRLIDAAEDNDFSTNAQTDGNISDHDKLYNETNKKNTEDETNGNRNDNNYGCIIMNDEFFYMDQTNYIGAETETRNSNNNDNDKTAFGIGNLLDNANIKPLLTVLGNNDDPQASIHTEDIHTRKANIVKDHYLRLYMLSRFALSVARFYSHIWHKVVTIFQRFYHQ